MTPPHTGPQRVCCFCGRPGEITKEHAWPQWLARSFGPLPGQGQTTYHSGYARTSRLESIEMPNIRRQKNAAVTTSKLREVCKPCNSGWMSRLESDVAPLLQQAGRPAFFAKTAHLLPQDAALLASWAIKTAWVRERLEYRDFVASPAMRQDLSARSMPPPYTVVHAVGYAGEAVFSSATSRMELTRQELPWDSADVRRVARCLLVLPGVAFHVRTADGPGAAPQNLTQPWKQLWPLNEGLAWPPSVSASASDFTRAVVDCSWMTHPETFFRRHGDGGWASR